MRTRFPFVSALRSLTTSACLFGAGMILVAAPALKADEPTEKRVMVTPILFPQSDPAVTGPASNLIRQAYKNIFDPFWKLNSYENFEVISKTYGYVNMQWPKDPEPGTSGGPATGAAEAFAETFSMGGNWIIEDGIWTPGERFRDANGNGAFNFADPWTDVQVSGAVSPGNNNGAWDNVGEHFVDLDNNGQFTPVVIAIEIYDRDLDNDFGIPGNIPNDGLAGNPVLNTTQRAIREIDMNEMIPDAANGVTAYGGDIWPVGDYPTATALQNFVGDFPTQGFDNNGIPTGPVVPADGVFTYGVGAYIDTGNDVTYRTVTAVWDTNLGGGAGAWAATIADVTVNILRMGEPFTDADGNGVWTDREAFEDFLIRWDVMTRAWIRVTNQYIHDNYPPVMDGGVIYDVGELGPPSADGFGPYPGTVGGNGIADNAEYLMLRSGDGGGIDVDYDDVEDVIIAGPNGIFDGPESFSNARNTKMRPRLPLVSELEVNNPPVNWDPHGFYPGGWQDWWEQTFSSTAPDWIGFIKAEPFSTETVRPFNPTLLPLAGGAAGGVMPDATGAYYDSAREFRDLPSAIYHIGGDKRLGERTSPTSDSYWGQDIGNNMPPLDYQPDFIIESSGPLAYNINGEHGWDAGNQLTIELLTWRTDGRSLTDTAISNPNRQGGWAGLDNEERWCRDGNLDGLVDQGESPDAGFANYTSDGDPTTVGPEGGDNGRDTNYPYNYQRLYEDIVESWDHAEDFTLFSDTGDQVDYLAVIYPEGYGGIDFGGASGQKHSDSALFPYPADPTINGTAFTGGILTRDSTSLIRFGGQVRNMAATGEGGGLGASDYAMGIMAHEAAHDWLGAPDLYDYDVWNGIIFNIPVGSNDLMSGGGLVHFVGALKSFFGWIQPRDLKAELAPGVTQVIEMYPIETTANQYFQFSRGGESFWFWFENGQTTVPWPKAAGPGIHVLHEDLTTFGNAVPKQQRINNHFTWEMVQADGLNQLQDAVNSGDTGDPFPGATNNRKFNKYTNPASVWWDTTETGIEILDIQLPATANAPARVTFRWIYRDVAELSFLNPPGGSSVGSAYNIKYRAWDNQGDTSIYFYRDSDNADYDGTPLNAFSPATKIPGDQDDIFGTTLPNIPGTRLYNFYALLVPDSPSDGIGNVWWPSANEGTGSIAFPVAPTISTATVNPADNAALQNWTLTCTVPGGNGVAQFVLRGSVSGILGPVTAGAAFATGTGNFSGNFSVQVNATSDFAAGDVIAFKTTGWIPYSDTLVVVNGATPDPGGPIPPPVVTDLDGDGIDDVWEFDMFGNMTTATATSDTDGDGLTDLYEFYAGTDATSRSQADLDGDSDGDGLSNFEEQEFGTHPRLWDTDDDTVNDRVELLAGDNPLDPLYPISPRVLQVAAADEVVFPVNPDFELASWTVEAWVCPTAPDGDIVSRQVGLDRYNYRLGLSGGIPYILFTASSDGIQQPQPNDQLVVPAMVAVPMGEWIHLAATFDDDADLVKLYVNGVQVAVQTTVKKCALTGSGPVETTAGRGFAGMIDDVKIWNAALGEAEIQSGMYGSVDTNDARLVTFTHFDDGTSMPVDGVATGHCQNFHWAYHEDWLTGFANCATLVGGAAMIPSPLAAPAARDSYTDSNEDGIYNWWYVKYGFDPFGPSIAGEDWDGDGLTNYYEFLLGLNPNDNDTDNDGVVDGMEDPDGDGLTNLLEQQYRTHPLLADSDDDGYNDGVEVAAKTSPLHSMSKPGGIVKGALDLSALAAPGAGVMLPVGSRFDMQGGAWTVETWVKLGADLDGSLVRYQIPTSSGAKSQFDLKVVAGQFTLTVDTDLVNGGYGQQTVNVPLPAAAGVWTHVAGVYDVSARTLRVIVNGVVQAEVELDDNFTAPVAGNGVAMIGVGLADGLLDDVRVWSAASTMPAIDRGKGKLAKADGAGLVAYYRFDDGGVSVEDFAHRRDPLYIVTSNGVGAAVTVADSANLRGVNDSVLDYYDDSDGDLIPDWWESFHGGGADLAATDDLDGDGLNNLYEYRCGTDPNKQRTVGTTLDSQGDSDADLVRNIDEQTYGSDPRYADSDGDGSNDELEIYGDVNGDNVPGAGDRVPMAYWPVSNPADAQKMPGGWTQRGLELAAAGDLMTIPPQAKYALESWTVQAWAKVAAGSNATASVLKRAIGSAVNYEIGFEQAPGGWKPFARYTDTNGGEHKLLSAAAVAAGTWTHLCASFDSVTGRFVLYQDSYPVAVENDKIPADLDCVTAGNVMPVMTAGDGFAGAIDEIQIWGSVRDADTVAANFLNIPVGGGVSNVAVMYPNGDPVHERLDEMGIPYTFIDAEAVRDPATYQTYTSIFFPCLCDESPVYEPEVQQYLRDFVANGGHLYVACWANDYIVQPWPEIGDITDGGYAGDILCDVVDPDCAAFIGSDTLLATDVWDNIVSYDPAQIKKVLVNPGTGTNTDVIAFSFVRGSGKVIYTMYHSESGQDLAPEQAKFLAWVVSEIVIDNATIAGWFQFDGDGRMLDLTEADSPDNAFAHAGAASGAALVTAAAHKKLYTDSDGDGIPDWWEEAYGTNFLGKDAAADPDIDGLENFYEYLAGTDPFKAVSKLAAGSNYLLTDSVADSDGDGLSNGEEQAAGSYPGTFVMDLDDDGAADALEVMGRTNPANALDPFQGQKALSLTGTSGLLLPLQKRFDLTSDWTTEAWIRADAGMVGDHVIVRRMLDSDGNGTLDAVNYELGIRFAGGALRPYVRYTTSADKGHQTVEAIAQGVVIVPGMWYHIAGVYAGGVASLSIHVNGREEWSESTAYRAPAAGAIGGALTTVGYAVNPGTGLVEKGFVGMIDQLRVWSVVGNPATLLTLVDIAPTETLAAYLRFDDGGVGIQDFGGFAARDMYEEWRHSPAKVGMPVIADAGDIPLDEPDFDSDGDGLPDWWEMYYFGNLTTSDGTIDSDGDGLTDFFEYLARLNPTKRRTYNLGIDDGLWDADADGLNNLREQKAGTLPDRVDSDDDFLSDGEEVTGIDDYGVTLYGVTGETPVPGSFNGVYNPITGVLTKVVPQATVAMDPGTASLPPAQQIDWADPKGRISDPANSLSPMVPRVLQFDGDGDFAEVPGHDKFLLTDWTLETWVNVGSAEASDGAVLIRHILADGTVNYELGLEPTAHGLKPYALFTRETIVIDWGTLTITTKMVEYKVGGDQMHVAGRHIWLGEPTAPVKEVFGAIALDDWIHVAAVNDTEAQTMSLYINGLPVARLLNVYDAPDTSLGIPGKMTIGGDWTDGIAATTTDRYLQGYMDEVSIWGLARSDASILGRFTDEVPGSAVGDNLVILPIAKALSYGHAADKLIVRFKADVTNADALHQVAGGTVAYTSRLTGVQVVDLPAGSDLAAKLAEYRAMPEVLYAEPSYELQALKIPNDPQFGQLWGMHNDGSNGGVFDADIDAPEAWDFVTGSKTVIVAVIDTGVDYNHPDLAANMWKNSGEIPANGIDDDGNGYVDDVYGYDFANNDGDPMDDDGHGTHCAGTIGGVGNNAVGVAGVNWQVQIMALKFLGLFGGTTEDAIRAVDYAVANGAHLTSNSWGGGGFSQALYDSIAAAGAAGQVFVAAAGNDSNNNDANPAYPASYDLENIISVAATDRSDKIASFSNYGVTTVDLGAPGVDIYSCAPGGGYEVMSGTSMACPHVAGAAALMLSTNPGMGVTALKAWILDNVDPIPALDGLTVTGGRLNVANGMDGGGASIEGLLAYFRCDDGGMSAQDFTMAVNWIDPQRGAAVLHGNTAFVGMAAVANGLDSDGDGMPDYWEIVNGTDPDSPDASDDPDGDGLSNYEEYLAGTHPLMKDTDQNGVPDGYEDSDGDGLNNLQEAQLGTRPDLIDTDDDGLSDKQEADMGTLPRESTSPYVMRFLHNDGTGELIIPGDVPGEDDDGSRFDSEEWTIEALIRLDEAPAADIILVQRLVQPYSQVHFELGIRASDRVPYVRFQAINGQNYYVYGEMPVPLNEWTHVGGRYGQDPTGGLVNRQLAVYQNFVRTVRDVTNVLPARGKQVGDLPIARNLVGDIEELRIWKEALSDEEIISRIGQQLVYGLRSASMYSMEAANGYIASNETEDLELETWTVETWVKGTSGGDIILRDAGTAAADGETVYNYRIQINAQGAVEAWFDFLANVRLRDTTLDGLAQFINARLYGTVKMTAEGVLASDDKWHHIAFVFDGLTATLYQDGFLVDTVNFIGIDMFGQPFMAVPFEDVDWHIDNEDLLVGYGLWIFMAGAVFTDDSFAATNPQIATQPGPLEAGENYTGLIDEMRIFGVARSEDDIILYKNRKVTGLPGLRCYIDLDDIRTDGSVVDKAAPQRTIRNVGGVTFEGENAPIKASPIDILAPRLSLYLPFDDGRYLMSNEDQVEDFLHRGSFAYAGTLVGGIDFESYWGFTIQDHSAAMSHPDYISPSHPSSPFRTFPLPVDCPFVTDADGDGMPDIFEGYYGFDPNLVEDPVDDLNRTYDAAGDLDRDGLTNLYEYYAGTDPTFWDSDGDTISDADMDSDGDGIANRDEFWIGTHPGMLDTDDDGVDDDTELHALAGEFSNPNDGMDPQFKTLPGGVTQNAAMLLDGNAYALPKVFGDWYRYNAKAWTLECWVKLDSAAATGSLISYRGSFYQGGVQRQITFYELGVDGGVPYVRFQGLNDANNLKASQGYAVPANTWTHLAGVYSPLQHRLTVYVNGAPAGQLTVFDTALSGSLTAQKFPGTAYLGSAGGVAGAIDDVRIWNVARPAADIKVDMNVLMRPDSQNMICYYRFDDTEAIPANAPAGAEDFAKGQRLFGFDVMRQYSLRGITFVPGNPAAQTIAQVDDLDYDGLADYWEDLYFNAILDYYVPVFDAQGNVEDSIPAFVRLYGGDAPAYCAVYLGWSVDFTPLYPIPDRRWWEAPDRAWMFVDIYFEDEPGYLEMRGNAVGDTMLFINGVQWGEIAAYETAINDGDPATVYEPSFTATGIPGYADNDALAPYFHKGRNRIAVQLSNTDNLVVNLFNLELRENGVIYKIQRGDDPKLVNRDLARWFVYSLVGTVTPPPIDWNELEWWEYSYAIDNIADIDGDGLTNKEEELAGTNPLIEDDLNNPPQWPLGAVVEIFPKAADGTVARDALIEAVILNPATDADGGDTIVYEYLWYLNGAPIPGATEKYLDLAALVPTPGDTITVDVLARDIHGAMAGILSDTVDVANRWSPAMPTVVSFLPLKPLPGSQLSVTLNSADMMRVRWYRNHEFVVEQEAVSGIPVRLDVELVAGDVWYFKAYAYDNFGGRSGIYNSLLDPAVGSRLVGPRYQSPESGEDNDPPNPPVVRISPLKPTDLDDLLATIVIKSADPEGDHFAYFYQWYEVGEDGELTPMEGETSNFLSARKLVVGGIYTVAAYALDVFGNASPTAFGNVVIVDSAIKAVSAGTDAGTEEGEEDLFANALNYEENDTMAQAKRILAITEATFTTGNTGTEEEDGGDTGGETGFGRVEFDAPEVQKHAIYPADDDDWFYFLVPSQGAGRVKVLFETNDGQLYEDRNQLMTSHDDAFDTKLWIYDANGVKIAEVDDVGFAFSPGSSKYARWEGYLLPGKYYARVKSTNRLVTIEEYTVAYFTFPEAIYAPYMPMVAELTPLAPRTHDDLEVAARGGYAADGSQAFTYWYVWYRNGELVPFGTTEVKPWEMFDLEAQHGVGAGNLPPGFVLPNVLPSQYTAEGETWSCKVYTRDANGFSLNGIMTNEVVIGEAVWTHQLRIHKTFNGDIGDVNQDVTIGWMPGATHGFDKDLDAKLPPADTLAPPTPGGGAAILWDELTGASYSAGLENDALRMIRDWRPFGQGAAWYLIVEFGQDPKSCIIEWDSPSATAGGDLPFTISEVDGWDGIDQYRYRVTLDMRTNNRIVVPADELVPGGRKIYRISLGASEDGQSVHLDYGWNLISFAVTPVMPSVDDVFFVNGRTVVAGPVWTFVNNAYTKADSIEANRGYWIYCDIPGGVDVRVIGVRGYDMVPLAIGWNTVGPTETVEAPATAVIIYGYSNATDTYFDVNSAGPGLPAWHVPGKLVKGAGYWIQSDSKTAIRAQP